MSTKYVSGRVRELKIGITSYSESKESLSVVGRISGIETNNVIPFLYSNYSDLPSATTYHGAFAHVHATQKAYFAHGGNWIELVNKGHYLGYEKFEKKKILNLIKLCKKLNPNNEFGRLTLISRMGAKNIRTKLPPLINSSISFSYFNFIF